MKCFSFGRFIGDVSEMIENQQIILGFSGFKYNEIEIWFRNNYESKFPNYFDISSGTYEDYLVMDENDDYEDELVIVSNKYIKEIMMKQK